MGSARFRELRDTSVRHMYKKITQYALIITLLQSAKAESWKITPVEWETGILSSEGITLSERGAQATAGEATFKTQLKTFDKKVSVGEIQLIPSVDWLNWIPTQLTHPNMRNAPVMISTGPNSHWIFACYNSEEALLKQHKALQEKAEKKGKKHPPFPYATEGFAPEEVTLDGHDVPVLTTIFPNQYMAKHVKPLLENRGGTRGYHGWHSKDMKTWVHYGMVSSNGTCTSAEYVDGKLYMYHDKPNDRDPHLVIDEDLFDGIPGEDQGMVFDAPWGGSDTAVIRDKDGSFHLISENWDHIDASKRSWDAPVASHMVSADGLGNFEVKDYAVDERTTPTGKTATFQHIQWSEDDPEKTMTYEVYSPEQDAFGDWAALCIGEQYYLIGDYDPPKNGEKHAEMSTALFTSSSLSEKFRFYGHIGNGHPDPDIMFADGQFYIITQTKEDFMSDGPWTGNAEVRVGVDTSGDGEINAWSKWIETRETYSYTEGFAKIVAKSPARVTPEELPAGYGFQLEVKLIANEEAQLLTLGEIHVNVK